MPGIFRCIHTDRGNASTNGRGFVFLEGVPGDERLGEVGVVISHWSYKKTLLTIITQICITRIS